MIRLINKIEYGSKIVKLDTNYRSLLEGYTDIVGIERVR